MEKFVFKLASTLALVMILGFGLSFSTAAAMQADKIEVGALLNPDGTLNMTSGASGALDLKGWQVRLDSVRGPVVTPTGQPNVPVSRQEWSALANNGLNGHVYALAVSGNDLYVGGAFTETADGAVTNLNNIARFSDGTWSALPNNGLNGHVYALAVSGSNSSTGSGQTVYVGGAFTETADGSGTNLTYIAKFSEGAWSALPNNGLNGYVYALSTGGNDPSSLSGQVLYVGGNFHGTADGTTTLHFIAKFSEGAWFAFPNMGLNGSVRAMAVSGGAPSTSSGQTLYVGGYFHGTADNVITNLNRIARFSEGAWSALPNNGLNGKVVFALAVSDSDLYVGGYFHGTADGVLTNMSHVAKFSEGAWSALPHGGLAGKVLALAVSGRDLYAGGTFESTSDNVVRNLNQIARLSDGAWSALSNDGLNSRVQVLQVNGSDLYAGGRFSRSADGAFTNLNGIAQVPCPGRPEPISPTDSAVVATSSVTLRWADMHCAAFYNLKVKDLTAGTIFVDKIGHIKSKAKVNDLAPGHEYWWQVRACNQNACRKGPKIHFVVSP